MKKSDQETTSFIMPYGLFYYITMPFGLKNVGATYQRTMQKCFNKQIKINAKVYINDIVVKSCQGSSLLADLQQTFNNLRGFYMKLNSKKMCIWGPQRTNSGIHSVPTGN